MSHFFFIMFGQLILQLTIHTKSLRLLVCASTWASETMSGNIISANVGSQSWDPKSTRSTGRSETRTAYLKTLLKYYLIHMSLMMAHRVLKTMLSKLQYQTYFRWLSSALMHTSAKQYFHRRTRQVQFITQKPPLVTGKQMARLATLRRFRPVSI